MYRKSIGTVRLARSYASKTVSKGSDVPLYLNPHAWQGLPADRIFELHNMRKSHMGDKYVPNDEERRAILSTVADLKVNNRPELEYVYALDHFKAKLMNNTPSSQKGKPPKLSGVEVIKQGETKHKERKMDELMRVAAYEMPLLAKFRKPYQPPSNKEAPLVLNFRDDFSNESTTFNRLVSLIVKLEDLSLNETQQRKFKILAGQRFDHETNELRIASDRYSEATQNAKWLVETFNKLMQASKDTTDDLSDIPIDTRHTKAKIQHRKKAAKHQFPEEWKRPQDAPLAQHKIVQKLVEKVKHVKDAEYLENFRP